MQAASIHRAPHNPGIFHRRGRKALARVQSELVETWTLGFQVLWEVAQNHTLIKKYQSWKIVVVLDYFTEVFETNCSPRAVHFSFPDLYFGCSSHLPYLADFGSGFMSFSNHLKELPMSRGSMSQVDAGRTRRLNVMEGDGVRNKNTCAFLDDSKHTLPKK